MTKLSEILELAMPSYTERVNYGGRGNMCCRISELEDINRDDRIDAAVAIKRKLEGHLYLDNFLESKGRKTTPIAKIRFYKAWIKELKQKGL